MKNLLKIALILALASTVAFGMIPRVAEIPMPEDSLNNGGVGDMVAGVDIDQDGQPEIYVINDNWNDGASELIPRIYKLEKEANGTDWNVVWSSNAEFFVSAQNTWPALELADLDADGKMELVWGVVNNGGAGANPYRILVYEHAGGDNFGIDDGAGNWEPTAMWTITDTDAENIRPNRFFITDIDDDGVDEICFDDRKGASGDGSDYYFGIASVDNIPDDGDGSETWTLEVSGKDFSLATDEDNKWDVFVVNDKMYASCEDHLSQVYYNGSAWQYQALDPLPGGATFRSAQVMDLDEDGSEEVILAEYAWGSDTPYMQVGVDNGDSLIFHQLFIIDSLDETSIMGGGIGDLDNDDNPDFVFGSRVYNSGKAPIFRLEYNGGTVTDPLNWELTTLDSAHTDGRWDVIGVGNLDGDPYDEVAYSSCVPGPDGTFPIVILDDDEAVGVKGILIPSSFELGRAYPNPFNPSTVIPFTLNEGGYVSLKIYDVKGGCIATLLNGNMDAGSYDINFDASELTSGVYLYQLQLENTFRAGKLVLNK